MDEVLAGKEGIRVGRPVTADLRISGFEESVAEEEVRETLSSKAGVFPSTIAVGPIRKAAGGLCTVVVKCPLAAANALTRAGKLALEWSSAKVEMLEKRPLQCYKCFELGHTRAACRSEADRTGVCYRCGEAGHPASGCMAPTRCAVCASKGLPHDHRVGGPSCQGSRKTKAVRARKPAEESAAKVTKAKTKLRVTKVEVVGFQVNHEGRLVAGTGSGAPAAPLKVKRRIMPPRKAKGSSDAKSREIAGPFDDRIEVEIMPSRGEKKPTSLPMETTEEGGGNDLPPQNTEEEGAEDSGKGYM